MNEQCTPEIAEKESDLRRLSCKLIKLRDTLMGFDGVVSKLHGEVLRQEEECVKEDTPKEISLNKITDLILIVDDCFKIEGTTRRKFNDFINLLS